MRASSFSSAKVISLLNSYFVPVHMSNQDHDADGSAPPEVKAEKNRIYRDALAAGMKAGTVCAYMVAPDGRPVAAAPLNESVAGDPDRLAELMERVIRELKTAKGDALVRPKPMRSSCTSSPATCSAGGTTLSLTMSRNCWGPRRRTTGPTCPRKAGLS